MMDSDDVIRVYTQIVNGTPKADSVVLLTPELSALWDEIAADIEDYKASGFELAVPNN